jgi:hypothetical protein
MIETITEKQLSSIVHLSRTVQSPILLCASARAFDHRNRWSRLDGFLLRSFLIVIFFLEKRAIKRVFKLATKIRRIMDRQLSIRRSVNARLTRLSRNALRHQIHLLLGIRRKGHNYDTFVHVHVSINKS